MKVVFAGPFTVTRVSGGRFRGIQWVPDRLTAIKAAMRTLRKRRGQVTIRRRGRVLWRRGALGRPKIT